MTKHIRRPAATAAAVTATALAAALMAPPAAIAAAGTGRSTSEVEVTTPLRDAVTVAGIQQHLEAFDTIGAEHGNRAAGGPGYDASVEYVLSELREAGYEAVLDTFEFVYNADNTPPVLSANGTSFVDGVDFSSMTFSPSADIPSAPTYLVPVDGDTGCQPADFTGFPSGAIALVKRGGCTFATKGANADAAGAAATVVYNNAAGIINGTLGGVPTFDTPVIGATPEVGEALAAAGTARLKVDRVNEERTTVNILADLVPAGAGSGKGKDIVVVGAHLDSVPRGAGVNDNGSGSAAILEIAQQMARGKNAKGASLENTVRFAWWGAEEFGLLGSEAYVEELKTTRPEELGRIKANLNFDMIGSPNYVRFVYDGDNSAYPVGPGAAKGPEGSGEIERIFADYFRGVGLPSAETPFSGRSDYGPFIAEGIAAGGLFTGAEGLKTEVQAQVFGGTAGVAYDRCYHLGCDTIANVNLDAIDEMGDAAAHATLVLARRDLERRPLVNPATPVTGTTGTNGGGGLHEDHDHEGEMS